MAFLSACILRKVVGGMTRFRSAEHIKRGVGELFVLAWLWYNDDDGHLPLISTLCIFWGFDRKDLSVGGLGLYTAYETLVSY